MKKTIKNIFAVVLGLIVVLSLAGCSHEPDEPEVVVKDMGEATVTSNSSIRVNFENDEFFYIDLIQIDYDGNYDYKFNVYWVGQKSENAAIYGLNISGLDKLPDVSFLKICDTKDELLALFPEGQDFGGYIMVNPTLRVNFNIPADKVSELRELINTVFTEN